VFLNVRSLGVASGRSPVLGLTLACLSATALATGCAQDPTYGSSLPPGSDGTSGAGGDGLSGVPDAPVVPVGPVMQGLHVVGNHIENSDGLTVKLRGVNRAGSEYQCTSKAGIFDGPATLASIRVMAEWKINAVRIPLNETCWLGINGLGAAYSGDAYRKAIVAFVNLFHQYHIVPILDLHWAAPGTAVADRLQPMPDADHAAAFWTDVATTFIDDDGVIFELFNEPFPDHNHDSVAGWSCWRDGCTANLSVPSGQPATTYQAIGMQALVDAIRATGSRNLVLAGALQYSNTLSQWLTYAPVDPAANLGAAWHVYNFNACNNAGCWDSVIAGVAAAVPIVTTELGEASCGGTFIGSLLTWADAHGLGYLAWTWNAWGACVAPVPPATMGGRPWALIRDFASGTPNSGYALTYHDHLAGAGDGAAASP
jgi:hypothetical protein